MRGMIKNTLSPDECDVSRTVRQTLKSSMKIYLKTIIYQNIFDLRGKRSRRSKNAVIFSWKCLLIGCAANFWQRCARVSYRNWEHNVTCALWWTFSISRKMLEDFFKYRPRSTCIGTSSHMSCKMYLNKCLWILQDFDSEKCMEQYLMPNSKVYH